MDNIPTKNVAIIHFFFDSGFIIFEYCILLKLFSVGMFHTC